MKNVTFKTRHALVLSCISLMTCFAMLLGTTFAWFTDSVTSGVNRIISGNLDVELEYYDPSATTNEGWKNAADADAIFIDLANNNMLSRDSLWEPGHTEVAYLRLRNAGTLALNYQLSVYLASEQKGINAAGDEFKLSDYLYYGITAPSTTQKTYTAAQRAQARTDAGTDHTVSANDVQATGVLLGTEHDWQYVTMIVYMPEETGNIANYKTGTAAPEIGLGVRLLATQQQAEADSFGTDYDAAAEGQFESRPVVSANSSSTVTSLNVTITTNEDTQETTYTGGGATITTSDGVASMTINKALAQKLAQTATASTEDSETITSAQVVASGRNETTDTETSNVTVSYANVDLVDQNGDKIDLEALNNTEDVTTSVYVGTGILGNITVKLNPGQSNEQVFVTGNNATYDSESGKVTFAVKHFCPMEISYKEYEAVIGETLYETLAGALSSAVSGDTVNLLKDIVVSSFVKGGDHCGRDLAIRKVPAGVTLNGGNHSITMSNATDGAAVIGEMYGTLKNITLSGLKGPVASDTALGAKFVNVTANGAMAVDGNEGAFATYVCSVSGVTDTTIEFTDCVANVNMTGTGTATDYNAAFVGYFVADYTHAYFTNCVNKGNIVCGSAGMFIGNVRSYTATINITNCKNEGLIHRTFAEEGAYRHNQVLYGTTSDWSATTVIDGVTYTMAQVNNKAADNLFGNYSVGTVGSTLSLTQNQDGTFTFTSTPNAAKYVVNVGLYTSLKAGGSTRNYMSQEFTSVPKKTDIKNLRFVDGTWVTGNSGATPAPAAWNSDVTIYTLGTESFYLIHNTDTEEFRNHAPTAATLISVSAYDADGALIASTGLTQSGT